MNDLPQRCGSLVLVDVRMLQTSRQRETYAMARCDCGVMTKVRLHRWRRQAVEQCSGCARAETHRKLRERKHWRDLNLRSGQEH